MPTAYLVLYSLSCLIRMTVASGVVPVTVSAASDIFRLQDMNAKNNPSPSGTTTQIQITRHHCAILHGSYGLQSVMEWHGCKGQQPQATGAVQLYHAHGCAADDSGTFNFGYTIRSGEGASNFRHEVRDPSGRVIGSYGIIDVDGRKRVVEYIADAFGFRAKIKSNEPGATSQNSPPGVLLSRSSVPLNPTNIQVVPLPDDDISGDDQGERSYTYAVPVVNSVEPRKKTPQPSRYKGPIYASYYPIDTPKLYDNASQEKTVPSSHAKTAKPSKGHVNTASTIYRLTLLKVV